MEPVELTNEQMRLKWCLEMVVRWAESEGNWINFGDLPADVQSGDKLPKDHKLMTSTPRNRSA